MIFDIFSKELQNKFSEPSTTKRLSGEEHGKTAWDVVRSLSMVWHITYFGDK